jgi:hypothetical protein
MPGLVVGFAEEDLDISLMLGSDSLVPSSDVWGDHQWSIPEEYPQDSVGHGVTDDLDREVGSVVADDLNRVEGSIYTDDASGAARRYSVAETLFEYVRLLLHQNVSANINSA